MDVVKEACQHNVLFSIERSLSETTTFVVYPVGMSEVFLLATI